MNTTTQKGRQPLDRFSPEERLALLLEIPGLPRAARRIVESTLDTLTEIHDANLIEAGRRNNEERRLENGWIF